MLTVWKDWVEAGEEEEEEEVAAARADRNVDHEMADGLTRLWTV